MKQSYWSSCVFIVNVQSDWYLWCEPPASLLWPVRRGRRAGSWMGEWLHKHVNAHLKTSPRWVQDDSDTEAAWVLVWQATWRLLMPWQQSFAPSRVITTPWQCLESSISYATTCIFCAPFASWFSFAVNLEWGMMGPDCWMPSVCYR